MLLQQMHNAKQGLELIFWAQVRLPQKYYAPQVGHGQGSNP